MRSLVVDPDPIASEQARACLGEMCASVIVVPTAEQALAIARAHEPIDLILLALELPDLDGISACRRLARLVPGVPILATSSRGDEDVVVRALDAGAHDYLSRPLRLRELAARARGALQLRAERSRHARHELRLARRTHLLERARRDLESTACIDQVTGIANRRHFDKLLHAEWRRAVRRRAALSLVMFDLDDFHAFNSHYGHLRGDACLARVTRAMAHGLRRASDVLARYGGEEFVAILPDTAAHGACVVAERLRRRVEELALPHSDSRCGSVVTLSAGVATRIPRQGIAPEVLIEAADAALYRAKRDGRNRYRAELAEVAPVVVAQRPWPVCPVVVLDPVLVQRVPRVLEHLRTDLGSTADAIADGELARGSTLGSRIRRMSGDLGIEGLAELAGRLEDTARRGEREAAAAALAELGWYLEHVQVVYRRPTLPG